MGENNGRNIEEGPDKEKIANSDFAHEIANSINFAIDRNDLLAKLPKGLVSFFRFKSRIAELQHTAVAHQAENSLRDSFTGFWNKDEFEGNQTKLAMSRVKRQASGKHKRKLNYIIIDVNNFKLINDTLGHDIGDVALKKVVQAINGSVRDVDTVGRIGNGDEIGILAEEGVNDTENYGELMRDRIMSRLEELSGQDLNLQKIQATFGHVLSLSMGITTYFGEEDVTPEILRRRADEAMYLAKRMNHNDTTLQRWTPDLEKTADVKA